VQSSGTDPLIISSLTVNGASQLNGTLTAGVNDTGYDVKFFGATSGAYMLWDESADDLKLVGAAGLTVAGNIDVDGTTNLDAVDIDGAVQIDGIVQVGVDGTGYDVKLFGDASGSYALWDQSSDDLILAGAAGLSVAGGSVLTGVTTHGGNVVSDADSTDDLGTTSVRWANLFVDGITATDQITATGFTGTLDGILGSGAAAAATVTTLTTSGIASIDDTTDSTSGTTGSIHTDGGLGVAKDIYCKATIISAEQLVLGIPGSRHGFVASGNNMYFNIDSDNNSASGDLFAWGKDRLQDTGGTTLMTLGADGKLGIGTTAAASLLHVAGTVQVGVDDTGHDVKFFGATSGKSLLWDESADSLIVTGTTTLVGTTNLDAVDIDGATQIDGTVAVGVDGTGYDVKFFGDTTARFLLWDQSADSLLFTDNAKAVWGQPGNDLQITHDGSNSFITDAGTGNLYLDSAAGNIYLRTNASENALEAVGNGAVTLYYDNAAKFATVTGGVNITGELEADSLDIDGATQIDGTVTVGVDDTGYDVKFFGATSGSYMLWDESTDDLILGGAARLGIGTTAPTGKLQVAGANIDFASGENGILNVFSTDADALNKGGSISLGGNSNSGLFGFALIKGAKASTDAGYLAFGTRSASAYSTERMRISSAGQVFINCTAAPSDSVAGVRLGNPAVALCAFSCGSPTTEVYQLGFYNGNGLVGRISTSGSATSYTTSSDYRLKENVVTEWDATTRLKQLKPSRFNFIADADTTFDGFLAHEAQAVVPECVTGVKDEVDADGNPILQGIDQSKIVPLLVKTIQELEARITTLEG
jgi:cytoskeletal protein CcmA (bactofilin family)